MARTQTQSGFAIVRVDERQAVRIVGAIHVGPTGNGDAGRGCDCHQSGDRAGQALVAFEPMQPLTIGEYALVEILSARTSTNRCGIFGVDPATGDNPGSIGPILKQPRN